MTEHMGEYLANPDAKVGLTPQAGPRPVSPASNAFFTFSRGVSWLLAFCLWRGARGAMLFGCFGMALAFCVRWFG